jgi:hypothetical protein
MMRSEVRGLVERVGRPRIEDGGKKHFVFESRTSGGFDRLESLQRIRHDATADDNMESATHSGDVLNSVQS